MHTIFFRRFLPFFPLIILSTALSKSNIRCHYGRNCLFRRKDGPICVHFTFAFLGNFISPGHERPTKGRCWFSTLVTLAFQPLQFCLHFCGWQPPMRQVKPIKQAGKHRAHNLSATLAQELSHGIQGEHVDRKKTRRGP